jgi:hypothetical protein
MTYKIVNHFRRNSKRFLSRKLSSPSPRERGLFTEQSFATPPTLSFGEVTTENLSQLSMEFMMTIQSSVEQLTKKQASMLLSILNVDILRDGMDFNGYLTMEYLFNFLLKSHTPLEEQFEETRKSLLVSQLILTATRGEWITLGEREKLSDEVIKEIHLTSWIPSDRTVNSWRPHFDLQKFLKVRIVRLDSFETENRDSVRYSSYTKGYGEGGKLSPVKKTPFSFELDGDYSEKEPPKLDLLELSKYGHILAQIEEWKSIKKKTKGN